MTEATAAPPPWSALAGQNAVPPSGIGRGASAGVPAGFGRSPEERDQEMRFAAAYERARAEQTASAAVSNRPPLHTERSAIAFGKPEEMDRATPPSPAGQETGTAAGDNFFGEDGLTFGDVLDIINPLQHIPGVSSLYRSLTGDEISPGARIAGGTLFGGPVGFASALANTVVEETTGTDIAGNVMAALTGEPAAADIADPESGVQTAALTEAAAPAAASLQTLPANTAAPEVAIEDIAPAAGTSPLFAAQPPGGGPIFASQLTRQSPLADPNALAAAAPSQDPDLPAAPPSSANTLSPQVHEALMRMAEQAEAQSRVATQITPPPALPPAGASGSTLAPGLSAADSAATAGRTQTAGVGQTGGYIDPVAPEDLPNAMMEALARYEAMSRNQ